MGKGFAPVKAKTEKPAAVGANLHLVTAWVAEQNLTLGQIKVEAHKT